MNEGARAAMETQTSMNVGRPGLARAVALAACLAVAGAAAQDGYPLGSMGDAALARAAGLGHAGVAKALIEEAGADPNAPDRYGQTALMAAAGNGRAEVVGVLIKAGADVDAQNLFGWMALMAAAGNGRAEVVGVLIKAGADVDAQNMFGWTALMAAAGNGHMDVVVLLVEAGADLDLRDKKDRRTASEIAGLRRRHDVAAFLERAAMERAAMRKNLSDKVERLVNVFRDAC